MTRAELVQRVRRDRPGESTDAELNLWIDQLDEKWRDEVILTHEGWPMAEKLPEIKAILKAEEPDWIGGDGAGTAAGLTITRQGNIIRLHGTSTAAVNVLLTGEELEILAASETTPSRWYTPTGDGVGSAGYTICYASAGEKDGPLLGLSLGLLKNLQGAPPLLSVSLNREDHMLDTTGIAQANNGAVLLQIGVGMTFRDYALWLKVQTVRPNWPGWWHDGVALAMSFTPAVDWLKRDLLIPAIDEETYIYWLYSKVDFRLGEMGRYNNDATMFNTAWDTAAKRWHRHHLPLGRQLRHVVYGHPVPWRPWEDPLDQRRDRHRT